MTFTSLSAPEGWESIDSLSLFNFSDEPTKDLYNEGDFVVVEDDLMAATASKVAAVGRLKLKGNGFVYLDVSNQFIEELWQHLPNEGLFDPVGTKVKKMGAHISVIHEDEMIGNEIWDLAQAGESFTFEVKELRYIDIKVAGGKKRLWVLAVDAPALQRLRMHYGLKPKLKNHDFHITIGSETIDCRSLNVGHRAAEAA